MENLDFGKFKKESTSSTSPILNRTSDFYDNTSYIQDFDQDNRINSYDSVSAFSGSTIAESEFVAQQIKQFERENNAGSTSPTNKATVYNLRIDKVVIDAHAKKEGINKEAVDQIFSNFKTSPKKAHKWEIVRDYAKKPKMVLPALALLILVVGLSIGLPLITKQNNKIEWPGGETTEEPVSTDTSDTPTKEVTETSDIPPSSTPEEVPVQFQIVERFEWEKEGLPLEGKYKQLLPIQKIIVMKTITELPCIDKISCIDAIVNLQQEAYPDFDDIRENFLIASDGWVYAGRGFGREGQTTFSNSVTSFNSQAISISFLMAEEDIEPSRKQKASLCWFVEHSIENENLAENYTAFHQSLLVSSEDEDELNEDFGGCGVNWQTPPKIVKRKDWSSVEVSLETNFHHRRRSKNVIIASHNETCNSVATCSSILQTLQSLSIDKYGDIENFIFAGSNLIFEGTNFDVAVSSDFYDSLHLLILADIQSTHGQEIFKNIDAFLKFAVGVSKLTPNYRLYGKSQVDGSSDEALLEIIKNDPHFDENFDQICNFQCTTET